MSSRMGVRRAPAASSAGSIRRSRRLKGVALAAGLGIALAIGVFAQSTAADSEGDDVLRFDVMTPVTEPFTGTANPIRGVSGGGLPWEIDEGEGRLRSDGRLKVKVEGLVLARRDPVPANRQGTNPIPQFRAIVSCLTTANPTTPVNVMTDPVPASPTGDARIRATVDLPEPCIAPIVFVTAAAGQWFAVTGA
jgi:hypothetical protein